MFFKFCLFFVNFKDIGFFFNWLRKCDQIHKMIWLKILNILLGLYDFTLPFVKIFRSNVSVNFFHCFDDFIELKRQSIRRSVIECFLQSIKKNCVWNVLYPNLKKKLRQSIGNKCKYSTDNSFHINFSISITD